MPRSLGELAACASMCAALAACGQRSGPQAKDGPAVQIRVEAAGTAAQLEHSVAVPLELAMNFPGARRVHSITVPGRVVVTVELANGDVLAARREIFDRLQRVDLPPGVHPELGPYTTATGAVLRYALHGDGATAVELRTVQDWLVRPALMSVRGVVEVATCGGAVDQIELIVDPSRLGPTTILELANAIGREIDGTRGQMTLDDLGSSVIGTVDGVPLLVRDVAKLQRGAAPATCYVVDDRGAEIVEGIVWMVVNEDPVMVRAAVKQRLGELAPALPPAVSLDVMPDSIGAVIDLGGATFAEQMQAARRFGNALRGEHATIAVGDLDDGFTTSLPGALRMRLAATPDVALRVRRVLGDQQVAIAGEPGAWIRISGDSLDELTRIADAISTLPSIDVVARAGLTRVPATRVEIDRASAARHGIPASDLLDVLRAAGPGFPAGTIIEGRRRIDVVLRVRGAVDELTINAASGAVIPIAQVATLRNDDEPTAILRDGGRRWAGVHVRIADAASRRALLAQLGSLALPPGYVVELVE